MSALSKILSRRFGMIKKALLIIGAVALILVIQTLPVFLVMPPGAKSYSSKDVVVYYEPGDETGAREVFDLVRNNVGSIAAKLQYDLTAPLEIYVYKTQFSLTIREAGFATLLLNATFFIGDSEAGVIKMVSPYAQVQGHTHDTILNGTLHEVVHSIDYFKNPKLSYFWDNGLATYLARQTPDKETFSTVPIPTPEDMKTDNGMRFSEMGGYAYSYNYVEYLDKTYGWDKILDFASGKKNYQEAFGKSEQAIYADWGEYLKRSS